MTTSNEAPALEAAMNETSEAAEALQGSPFENPNEQPNDDGSTSALSPDGSPGAVTPLEKVVDWSELERRLHSAETGDPEPEEPAGDPARPGAGETSAEARGFPKNYRFRTDDPQRARFYQLMRQHPEENPADLARLAGYADNVPAPTPAPSAPIPEFDPLQPLRDEIAALAQQKRRHREAYEFDKADEAGERLLEARLNLEHQTRAVAQAKVSQARYDTAYSDARTEAAKLHPGALQPGSRQFRLVRMLVAAKEQESPEFFHDPAYPLRLLGELERDFPESFPRGAGGRARAANSPATRSRLLGQAVAGHATSTAAAHPDHLEAQIDGLSAEQLFALAHAVGTRPDAD